MRTFSVHHRLLATIATLAAPAGVAALASCGGTHAVDVTLQDSDGQRKDARFLEVLVYADGCPAMDALGRGELGSPQARHVVDAQASPPSLGELEPGSYGVAARLRSDECAVVAVGCVEADLASAAKVVIPVGAVKPPQGACGAGEACVEAACVASEGTGGSGGTGAGGAGGNGTGGTGGSGGNGTGGSGGAGGNGTGGTGGSGGNGTGGTGGSGGNGTGGTGGSGGAGGGGTGGSGGAGGGGTLCSLSLVQAGALPALADPAGGNVAGPAIVATDSGFVVAYREGSPDKSAANVALALLSDDGVLGDVSRQPIETCPGVTVDDGLGMALSPVGDVVLASRPYCPNLLDPSLDTPADLVALTFDRGVGTLNPAIPLNVMTGIDPLAQVTLARNSSLAFGANSLQAAFLSAGLAYRATVDAVGGAADVTPLFATGGSSYAQLSAANDVIATLTTRDAETQLLIEPPGAAGFVIHQALSPMGSLATWSNAGAARIAAATRDPYGAMTWSAMTDDGASLGAGTIMPSAGPTSVNMVALRDHGLIALGLPGGLELHKLKGALGAKLSLDGAGVVQQDSVGAESLAAFDGVRLGIAAARERVVVVWLTKHELNALEPTGGFAVYACEE